MKSGQVGDKPDYSEAKIVVAMVGLPARGKRCVDLPADCYPKLISLLNKLSLQQVAKISVGKSSIPLFQCSRL
jgi:hypothetical protein